MVLEQPKDNSEIWEESELFWDPSTGTAEQQDALHMTTHHSRATQTWHFLTLSDQQKTAQVGSLLPWIKRVPLMLSGEPRTTIKRDQLNVPVKINIQVFSIPARPETSLRNSEAGRQTNKRDLFIASVPGWILFSLSLSYSAIDSGAGMGWNGTEKKDSG